VSSDAATKAAITVKKVSSADAEAGIRADESIYNQKIPVMLDILRDLDDGIDSVMLVGHDPSFSILARQFAPEFRVAMPKSSIVAVAFDVSRWRDVPESTGKLAAFAQPGE